MPSSKRLGVKQGVESEKDRGTRRNKARGNRSVEDAITV